MDEEDFLGPKPIVIELRAKNRWESIDELIDHLVAQQKIKAQNRDAIVAAVKQRELTMSTAIGFGIGIPHATTGLISDVVVAIGRSRDGVQFDTPDGKTVSLVALLLIPEGQFQKHLNTLANLAKLLHRADLRDGL